MGPQWPVGIWVMKNLCSVTLNLWYTVAAGLARGRCAGMRGARPSLAEVNGIAEAGMRPGREVTFKAKGRQQGGGELVRDVVAFMFETATPG